MKKFAIIAHTQFKGQTCVYTMNAGVKCSEIEEEAIAQFHKFIAENPVKAKLIRVNPDYSSGDTVVESSYTAPLIV